MATFMEGFAQGFVGAREKKLARDAERENTMFKYQMDSLMEQKSKRDAQKQKEALWASQAKAAAERAGDPSFAPEALIQFRSGRTIDDVYRDLDSGNYSKDKNFKAPSQTVVIPPGVDPAKTEIEEGNGTYKDPMVSAPNSEKGLLTNVSNKVGEVGNRLKDTFGLRSAEERVNSRIDEIDPNLRKDAEETVQYQQPESPTGWVYKKKNEVKLMDLGDAMLKRNMALRSGDAAAVREVDEHIRINQIVEAQKAEAQARAQGKDVVSYVTVNKDGTIGRVFSGRTVTEDNGNPLLIDVTDPRSTQVVDDAIVPMDEKALKEYADLSQQFGKESSDYNAAQDQYVGALYNMKQIDDILNRNKSVTTYAATGAELINTLQDEVKGVYQALSNQDQELQKLATSNDPSKMAEFEKKLAAYENNAQTFLSAKNTDLAYDKAAYDTLRKLAAYKFAAANGISGQNLSDKDFQHFYDATGGGRSAPAVREALYNNAASVLGTLDARRVTLENNHSVKTFEQTYLKGRATTGLIPMRLQEKLTKMGANDLVPVLGQINSYRQKGRSALTPQTEQAPVSKEPTGNRQGKPMAQPQQKPMGPNQRQIDALKANPNMRDQFEQKFGPGSAAKILGE